MTIAPLTAPPQGISRTLLFILIEWAVWKLRAVLCAGYFDVVFGRVGGRCCLFWIVDTMVDSGGCGVGVMGCGMGIHWLLILDPLRFDSAGKNAIAKKISFCGEW